MDKKDYFKFLEKPKVSYKISLAKPTDTYEANYKKYLNKYHKVKTHKSSSVNVRVIPSPRGALLMK